MSCVHLVREPIDSICGGGEVKRLLNYQFSQLATARDFLSVQWVTLNTSQLCYSVYQTLAKDLKQHLLLGFVTTKRDANWSSKAFFVFF